MDQFNSDNIKELNPIWVDAICAAIKGHSDTKLDNGKKIVHIKEIEHEMRGVRFPFLNIRIVAAYLRLADALDITSARIGMRRPKFDINDITQNDSNKHWKRIAYIKDVRFVKEGRGDNGVIRQIRIKIDDDNIDINNPENRVQIIDTLRELREYVEADLNFLNDNILTEERYKVAEEVVFETSELFSPDDLSGNSQKKQNEEDSTNIIIANNNNQINGSDDIQYKDDDKIYKDNNISRWETINTIVDVSIIDYDLEKKVSGYIFKNDLLNYGHYILLY